MAKVTKTQWVWAAGVLMAVITVVSDLGGAYSTAKDVFVAGFEFKVSVLWGLVVIAPIVVLIYLVLKKSGPHPSEVLSIENSGQYFEKIQSQLSKSKEEIIVFGLEKEWVFLMLVSVAMARARGCSVSVSYFDEYHERYRLLALLGCSVRHIPAERERDRFIGVLGDATNILNCSATARVARQREAIFGRHYFSALDFWIIAAARKNLLDRFQTASDSDVPCEEFDFQPEIIEISEDEIIRRLREVRFYNSATISLEEINVEETIPVSGYVSKFKINQVRDIIRFYRERGWVLFRPTGITLANGSVSPLIPPVIEIHNGLMYVAEGHTRLHTLRSDRVKMALVAIVRGVEENLPMEPCSWRKVVVVDEKKEKGDPKLARYIETGTHQGIWSNV